jgi:hypothetical protein
MVGDGGSLTLLCLCRKEMKDATVYQNLLFHVYMKLNMFHFVVAHPDVFVIICIQINMFQATYRPSSGAQNCTSSLWFCIRERLLDVVVAGCCPATTTSNNLSRMQNQRLLVQF